MLGLSLSTLVLAGSVEIANASADSPSAREGRGSARLQPRYSWYCVQSCPDKANYVKVSTDSSGLIICNGPYSGKCGWYNDAYCSQVAPNEFAGIGDVVGHTCPSGSTNAWCVAGYKYLYNGVRDQCDNSPIVGTCIRSCPDKGNYVSVYQKGSTIRCIGPWEGKCSWCRYRCHRRTLPRFRGL